MNGDGEGVLAYEKVFALTFPTYWIKPRGGSVTLSSKEVKRVKGSRKKSNGERLAFRTSWRVKLAYCTRFKA